MAELFAGFDARAVAIIGNSGSGKSTLAGQLSSQRDVAVLDLDTVAWQTGQTAMARDPIEAGAEVTAFLEGNPRGIVEGCYTALIEVSLQHLPLLLFLDPGVEACIAHCRGRSWEPHKYASADEQDARLEQLLDWVRGYYRREDEMSQAAHQALFDRYAGPKQHIRTAANLVSAWSVGGSTVLL